MEGDFAGALCVGEPQAELGFARLAITRAIFSMFWEAAAIHRVFANFKRWALGTYHGVRKPHLRRYLEEFVFRWNRRRHMKSSFDMLIDIATRLPHAGYRDFVDQAI